MEKSVEGREIEVMCVCVCVRVCVCVCVGNKLLPIRRRSSRSFDFRNPARGQAWLVRGETIGYPFRRSTDYRRRKSFLQCV